MPNFVFDHFGVVDGVPPHETHHLTGCYAHLSLARWVMPHLEYARSPLRIILIVAYKGEDLISGAINQDVFSYRNHSYISENI